jgi:hypothetical protein
MSDHEEAMRNIERLDQITSVMAMELQYWKDETATLKVENAALREIVEAVATRRDEDWSVEGDTFSCLICDAFMFDRPEHPHRHSPDCLVTKARALLDTQEDSR